MNNLLELHDVSRWFGDIKAVDNISLKVRAGQFVTLLGPSGCGKTTTLRLIAGFETPDSGTIRLKERFVAGRGVFVPPKDRHVGMVFQDYALFPHLNVAQNVGFGLRDPKSARTQEMLALVGLANYADRMPYELSGGQQQRVALARALAPQPDMLLLDEPFSNLDAALRLQVRSEMRTILRQTNATCIFVTHSQEEALSLSDLVAVMFAGKIVQLAPPQTLYERPATPEVATFIGEANFIPGEADGEFADCALGRVHLAENAYGRVNLLIRPEMLQLTAIETPGRTARVMWREYYGHDQRVGLVLDDNTPLTARFTSTQTITPDELVSVTVQSKVLAFQ